MISDGSISANKRGKVVNTVLTKIAGFLVHRLPNSTYAKDMGIEVKGIAQYHVASELSAESEFQNMMYTAMALQSLDAPTLVLKYQKMMGNYWLLRWGKLCS